MLAARVLTFAILAIGITSACAPTVAAADDLAAFNDPTGLAADAVTEGYPRTAIPRAILSSYVVVGWESNDSASRLAIDAVATEGEDPDVDQTIEHVPAPYELHGDGTTDANVTAAGHYAQLCPGRVAEDPANAPNGYFVGLRCGGDLDGDGWPDFYEIYTGTDPLDPTSTP